MATKLNSEFNYRTQVIGETAWERIKTLKGFLEGRIRAACLERVAEKKLKAKYLELDHARNLPALPHVVLTIEAELLELESHLPAQQEAFALNREEIGTLTRLLDELYAVAHRIPGYTDEQMFEANAENEFTTAIGRDIQAELIANGRPSAAKIRNAMSCPATFKKLQDLGLIPAEISLAIGLDSKLDSKLIAN